MAESLRPEYFDKLYADNPDPWDFKGSEYEASKYRQTIATLTRDRYARAFEIGCSVGVLTALLAQHCDSLLSVDVSEEALRQARDRCASLPNVQFQKAAMPAEFPAGWFDLTLVSEVGYYLSRVDLERLARLITEHALPGGQLLLVHWLPLVPDYPLTGDEVHDYFLSLPSWKCLSRFRAPRYRIELLQLNDEAGG